MSPIWFITILFGGIIIFVGLFRLLFASKSTEDIVQANKDTNKHDPYMKKYPEANVENFTGTFARIGLFISLGFVLFAFNWREAPEKVPDIIYTDLPAQNKQQLSPPILEIVQEGELTKEEEASPNDTLPPSVLKVSNVINIVKKQEPAPKNRRNDTLPTPPKKIEKVIEEEEEEEEHSTIQEEENVDKPEIFTIVEEMPTFPGGQEALSKFLADNLKYPPEARKNEIEGVVYVAFLINEAGKIDTTLIKRGLPDGGKGCDQEALRLISLMPQWKPGKQNGKKVKVAYTIPIRFKLDDK